MTREIKFRAWDEVGKQMVISEDLMMNGCDGFSAVDEEGTMFPMSNIMQYTGLKDKNGVEIYEGDILRTESGICFVAWYTRGACFRWMFDGNSESPLNYDDREVIGNIYENPELIYQNKNNL